MSTIKTRTWSGLVLETRIEYGSAARSNRGQYSGVKIHRLFSEYVVGLEAGYEPQPGTVGAAFKRSGRPQLFSCGPACGCTRGQRAGRPFAGLTAEKVTCDKCK